MYIDRNGNKYNSRKEYVNSPDLEIEDIYMYLLSGERTPQNEKEIKIKEQMDDIKSKGLDVETNLNF